MTTRRFLATVGGPALLTVLACTRPAAGPLHSSRSGDGIDPAVVAPERRDDYALFAARCSKCHSLARALDNGHVEDRFWERYVDRMRYQPGSGIAPEDVPGILRFLHYYSSAPREGAETKEPR